MAEALGRSPLLLVLDITPEAGVRVARVDAAFERLVGLAPFEVEGLDLGALFAADVAHDLRDAAFLCAAMGAAIPVQCALDLVGGPRRCLVTLVPAPSRDTTRVTAVVHDLGAPCAAVVAAHAGQEPPRGVPSAVTELEERLRRAEEQLRRAQRLEVLGALAASVAHDFNNILTVISSMATFVLDEMDVTATGRADVEQIRNAAVRAARLTRQLLTFTRTHSVELKVVDINAIIDGIEIMLERLIGEDVTLTILRGRSGSVLADVGQVERVITNLVVNARDAMPIGGRITIETRDVAVDETYASSHRCAKPGPYVVVAVTDTGIGMDEATKARIFEPFFTTKEPGRGTGLGLATVQDIVSSSGGFVVVRSEPGAGTTVAIHLPRVAGEPQPLRSPPSIEPSLRGKETILVVEDDDHVRTVIRTILAKGGYDVIEARNAGEALLIDEQLARHIDLLVSDVLLPRMSGAALAERLATHRDGLRVLLVSGGVDDTVERHEVGAGRYAFLPKPITPRTLLQKVREVLAIRT